MKRISLITNRTPKPGQDHPEDFTIDGAEVFDQVSEGFDQVSEDYTHITGFVPGICFEFVEPRRSVVHQTGLKPHWVRRVSPL